jgi:hypothetical protein
MSTGSSRFIRFVSLFCFLLLSLTLTTRGQQVADPNFDPKVARPAYPKKHPKVLFDEAHNNFHTADGRYKPFADLITSDGYQVIPNKAKFSVETLKGHDLLIIANALGAPLMGVPDAGKPAFTDVECDAVRDWVRGGGALLLIADHAPMGSAAEDLAKRFGVDMSKGYTADESNHEESRDATWLVYSRDNKLLTDHPITRGRDAAERINRVVTFTGQSLKGPEGSVAVLKLADTAIDLTPPDFKQRVSAAGRAQAVALRFGRGRVVVLGEAAMLTAQLAGPQKMPFGMNRPGSDDRQFALNTMHWLSRRLK